MKKLLHFFDKLEDRIRGWMSRRPIIYGLMGGVGVVLFWRGVWHTADYFSLLLFSDQSVRATIDRADLVDGLASFGLGAVLLLLTGLFVSNFIGNEIIISGLKGEKKIAEKTEEEVETEASAIKGLKTEMKELKSQLQKMVIG
jgi:hypothetical protein